MPVHCMKSLTWSLMLLDGKMLRKTKNLSTSENLSATNSQQNSNNSYEADKHL